MKQRIGIIGATGNLGSQLTKRLQMHGLDVLQCVKNQENGVTIRTLLSECDIVHVCAPVEALEDAGPSKAIVVLHDSVMATSRRASERYLDETAAIVHLLMNDADTAVVATDAPHHEVIATHLTTVGLKPHYMTTAEHDYLMARSQAPLALLCKTLLPYLYEKADKGLLTPSGQLLADTLRARELVWTEETIRSILRNPQLPRLIDDMQTVMAEQTGLQSSDKHAISKIS